MFGADANKRRAIEEILAEPKYSPISYSKNWKTWKEGVHWEKIFYDTAKQYNLTYDEVKLIFFSAWGIIDNHMRHISFPTILIPSVGELEPNTITFTKEIQDGEYIMEKALEKDANRGMPFFLQSLIKARNRLKIERACNKPSEIRRNTYTKEQLKKIYYLVEEKTTGRGIKVLWYMLTFSGEVGEQACKEICEECNIDYYHNFRLNNVKKNLF